METVAKFSGMTEYVLQKLVTMGYFQTRTEALRAGILELGKEYKLLDDPRALENEMVIAKIEREKERNKGVSLSSFEEIQKKYKTGGKK
jgi:Arc/MetJ-type ribon-helix-helix transcriptional regulator